MIEFAIGFLVLSVVLLVVLAVLDWRPTLIGLAFCGLCWLVGFGIMKMVGGR